MKGGMHNEWGCGLTWSETENWPIIEGKGKEKKVFALFSMAHKLIIQLQAILKPTAPQEIKQKPMQ